MMKLSAAPALYDPADEAQMRGALEREDARNIKKGVAADALYLIATDTGAAMRGTVDSAGTMTWTPIAR
jgi:hypothetical protein